MTPQNTSDSHSPLQVCPLCIIWARMPYAKRWSTPTTAYDTESALVIGYWVATRCENGQLCEKHVALILRLNQTQVANIFQELPQHIRQPQPTAGPCRVTNHTFITSSPDVAYRCSHENCIENARYEASANFDTNGHVNTVKQFLCAKHAIALADKESKPEPEEFKFGLKPLTNENTTTEAPPLPVVIPSLDSTQPNAGANHGSQQIQNAMDYALQPKPVITSAAIINVQLTPGPQPIDPRELARQAALMPPTIGRKMEGFIPEEPTPAEGDGSIDSND